MYVRMYPLCAVHSMNTIRIHSTVCFHCSPSRKGTPLYRTYGRVPMESAVHTSAHRCMCAVCMCMCVCVSC